MRRPNTVYFSEIKPHLEIASIAEEIHSRLSQMETPNAVSFRAIRREFSRRIANAPPQSVIQLALYLLTIPSDLMRAFSYEMLSQHRPAFEQLTGEDLLKFGEGIHSWNTVDCFAMYLSGPMWAKGSVSDKSVTAWAHSQDRWWRRAALVSTVALTRGGNAKDFTRVARICSLLIEDRDDMVVKALSWALREAAKKHPEQVRSFLAENHNALAARVKREVNNKLTTGLKTPRRRAKK
jgi:3-methyladenine DNA glycosylase AlkD